MKKFKLIIIDARRWFDKTYGMVDCFFTLGMAVAGALLIYSVTFCFLI